MLCLKHEIADRPLLLLRYYTNTHPDFYRHGGTTIQASWTIPMNSLVPRTIPYSTSQSAAPITLGRYRTHFTYDPVRDQHLATIWLLDLFGVEMHRLRIFTGQGFVPIASAQADMKHRHSFDENAWVRETYAQDLMWQQMP